MKIKNLIVAPLVLSSLLIASCAEEKSSEDSSDKKDTETMKIEYPTPILDRELFFGNPEISSGQLSPDGKYISFLKEYDGIMNIWVKGFDEPFENAYPLTNSARPLAGYSWTVDGKYILFVKDNDGDENMNVFAVDPTQKVEGGVPESRNLTPMKDVTVNISHVSQNNPDMLMVSINDRDKAWHDLYKLTISTGKLEKMYENTDRITSYGFDWDDNLRLLYKTDEQGNTIMYHIQNDKLTPIYETNVNEQASAVNWNEDNSKFYLMTNKGDLDLTTLYLMDPITKEMELIESDPEGKVDMSALVLDRNTRKMVLTAYTDDKTRYYWKDDKRKAIYEHLVKEFPGREIGFSSSTADYSKFLVSVSGDKYASESWFYDVETKELIHQYTPRPDLKKVEEHLAEMKPVRYPSSDGLEIPAYLTLPVGVEAKNLPTVVLVHGGPKGPRDYWGFNAFVQFLANRGYAVLQPNFRASGGYGKNFMNAGDLQWGKLMQDDITWGVKYLIDEGIANENKVAIMGGSYGGYATLAGLAFTPDVYACGVDIVGPSNIFTLLESVPAYWEAGRAFLYGMVGDPNTEEGKKRIKEASPLFSADKITKPLLVVQGANDPRVKKAEADQIVVALREKGHEVSYLLAEDEGHGFRKPINNMAMFAEIERFLAPILGGRYQEDMPEDVAKRLEEITVDVNTVEYSEKGDVEFSSELPEVNGSLKAAKQELTMDISVQGQNISMTTNRTISQEGDGWKVQDKTSGPMGEMMDEVNYNSTYRPVSRKMIQGGQEITVTYSDDKVSITMGEKVTDIAIEGVLLDMAPGFENVLALMSIPEEGITATAIDFNTMKAKTIQLTPNGEESLDGVDCNKLQIVDYNNEADKTEIWINKKTNEVVKTQQVIPAMNNAVMTITKAE